ncbi:GGDEF domain-containing protein [Vibrio sp. T187]|uniref:GGDEF domain-containing protein n=1 Tax=Vibrio TaxID=662 RepID=UPI0010C97A88|nr:MULTISPECIES: GGDEF domain-containing protein [Vibrio]MBW3695064.1 GGDEF domain-containing protein [Vibrio sp. T187]
MITNGLEKWLGISRTDNDFRESSFIFVSLTALTSILSFFVYYNIFVIPVPLLALIESIGIAFCLCSYFFLWRSRAPRVSAFIMVSVMTSVSLLFIIGTGNSEFALAFSFLTPVIAIFILGYKVGSLFSVVNFAIIAYFCLTDMHNWPPVSFDTISFVHLTTIYLFLFSVSYFYDSGRRRTMIQLEESNRKLHALSNTDALTNLSNRRHMETLLSEPSRAKWVAIIDIDNFKSINDQHGHEVGDHVLIHTAQLLKACIGTDGQVGRWGGEEFLLAFNISDPTRIEKHVSQLQQTIAEYDFGIGREVTVSCGAAFHQENIHSTTFRRADEALYKAKALGKNCYQFAGNQ